MHMPVGQPGVPPEAGLGDAAPPRRPRWRRRPLRLRLFLLAASGLLPLALVLLAVAVYLAGTRQERTQRAALELSQALATAVDAELQSTLAVLGNLTTTTRVSELSPQQLAEADFIDTLRRVVRQQGWHTLIVADERGQVVVRAIDAGNVSPRPVEPGSLAQALASRAPVVGSVARGPQGEVAFAVRMPVFQAGRLTYVLSAVVSPDRILNAVTRQQLPQSWVVSVYDANGQRVARSRANLSSRYSASLEALIRAKGVQGMGLTRTLEGVESLTGFSRVPSSGWVVAVGIPVAEAKADLYRLLAAVGAGTVVSLGLLAWLAWRMAGGITRPMDSIKEAAAAVGAGRPVTLAPLDVPEFDAVRKALEQAAAERDEASALQARIQTEREELLQRLAQALEQAEQASRNKDEFMALLGHELRNPLAPIGNALQLMALKADASTAAERGVIQRQLAYVTRLVDDLLDASRVASGRLVIDLQPLVPLRLLEQTLQTVKPMLGQRSLSLQVDPAAADACVLADEVRLVQVFNNLLGNALKFTTAQGCLTVQVKRLPGALAFVFGDDGAGMAPEELSRAFDLFYQAPNSPRHANGGLGLGLAIVKSLVALHHGTVRAESAGAGHGLQVTVELPLVHAPSEAAALPAAAPTGLPIAAGAPRVLVVDDNQDAADTLVRLLAFWGYEACAAYTGQAALQRVAELQPALAILDIGLPDMEGYDLARHLRNSSPPFAGPLVALTGYGQAQDRQRALDAGFDVHFTKPVDPAALQEALQQLLERTAV